MGGDLDGYCTIFGVTPTTPTTSTTSTGTTTSGSGTGTGWTTTGTTTIGFSVASLFILSQHGGVLFIQFHPPTNHPTYFSKWSRQGC